MDSSGKKGQRCPYCGEKNPEKGRSNCVICGMNNEDQHIVYVSEGSEAKTLCSIRCMDLMFESLKGDDNG